MNPIADEPGIQRRSRLNITREGYWVPTNAMSKHARIGLQYERYGLHAPHKARCELDRRNHLFSEFVARNGSLKGCDHACRDQPHVCVGEDLSWTLPKKIMGSGE